MVDLTLDKAQKWLSKSAAMDKRGVTKDLKKVVTYIKKKTKENWKDHKSPDGLPWAPYKIKPLKIGDRAKVAENKGKPIYRKIESSSTLKRVNKERGSGKSFNAIYRTKGKKYLKPAKNLIKQVAGGKTIAGHIERVNDNGFIVGTGFPAAKELHKDRKLMGVTKTDMKIINEILEQGYIDRVLKNR